MKVLVACEFSGIVREAFAKRGHDAVSCDLLPTEIPGKHRQEHVLKSVILEKWDLISFPPKLWRGFENIDTEPAWCFAVIEEHNVFEGKDPDWASIVIRKAKEAGFEADESGRMIKPPNFDELNEMMLERMYNA